MAEDPSRPEKPRKPRRRRPREDPNYLLVQQHRGSVKSGASWFYWIAGLSIVNSVVVLFKGEWNFLIGMGVTQFVDAIAIAIGQEVEPAVAQALRVIALGIDVCVASVFVLFGFLAHREKGWAFALGMVLYGLDGLLFLIVQDWLSFGFHVFALFCIFGGYRSLKNLRVAEAAWERSEERRAAEASEEREPPSPDGKTSEPVEKEVRDDEQGPYAPEDYKL